MRYASWFGGICGFNIALDAAGHQCVFDCEIDDFCETVRAARYGSGFHTRDIARVRAAEIPFAELWAAGFPCQDLSIAGKRGGIRANRSGLVWTLLDLAEQLGPVRRPHWLWLENVPGLLNSNRGGDFGLLVRRLQDLGYVGCYRVTDAQFFGVPQRRRRVFVVARLGASCPLEVLLEPEGGGWNPAARGQEGAGAAGEAEGGAGVAGGAAARGARAAREGDRIAEGELARSICRGSNDIGANKGTLVANALTQNESEQSYRGDGSDNIVVEEEKVAAPLTAKESVLHNLVQTPSSGPKVPALRPGTDQAQAFETRVARNGCGKPNGIVPTLKAQSSSGDGAPCVMAPTPIDQPVPIHADATRGGGGTAKTPCADAEGAVRLRHPGLGVGKPGDPAFTVMATGPRAVAVPEDGQVLLFQVASAPRPLTVPPSGGPDAFGLSNQPTPSVGSGVMPTLEAKAGKDGQRGGTMDVVAFAQNQRDEVRLQGGDGTLAAEPGMKQQTYLAEGAARTAPMMVRRLTPTECERLQGFPDGWTCTCGVNPDCSVRRVPPWVDPATFKLGGCGHSICGCKCSDSSRYKALGNSVAVPNVRWIADRFPKEV